MKNHLLLITFLFCSIIYSQKKEDKEAIKAMSGCYEIKFNFAETFSYSKDSTYKSSKVKHDSALEWAELVEDTDKKISIQHLLVVGGGMVIKHWRQDWLFENTKFHNYNGIYNGTHELNFASLQPNEVKGQWTQKVYEVDDSPRYQGTASWAKVDGRVFWQNTTDAPLPRREYTTRNDYNLLKRTNIHQIAKNGWVHNQDNDKVIRTKLNTDILLAQEKGYNTYTKVSDSRCVAAQKWWMEKKDFWSKVRNKWEKEQLTNKALAFKTEVQGEPLHIQLSKLKVDANQQSIDALIDTFLVSETY